MTISERLRELNITLPTAPTPVAAYVPVVTVDGFAYTAGQIPVENGVLKYAGKLGKDLSDEDGYASAQLCALNCLAVIQAALGSLDRIERIVKITVFVNSTPEFTKSPAIANGASELLLKIFGENGKHARSAVGVSSLPLNAATEVEMVVKVSSV